MSFIIKRKEPPSCCAECMFFKKKISSPDYSVSCLLDATPPEPWPLRYEQRGADCPIGEIPAHGRLIDASEKIRVQMYDDMTEDYHTVEMTIDDLLSQGWVEADAPTIIEAEEAKE